MMNIMFSDITEAVSAADIAQRKASSLMEEFFEEGTQVTFKTGNMISTQQATVIWANMTNGRAEIRITNNSTNKTRTINIYDIYEVLK